MVNRLAIEASASRLPPFMKAATNNIVYNALEPDRWREEAGTAMNTAQAPLDFPNWSSSSALSIERSGSTTAQRIRSGACFHASATQRL